MTTPFIPTNPPANDLSKPDRPKPAGRKGEPAIVSFHRTELGPILTVYGRMVAAGEWRDYAIDHLREAAVFSIFRRSAEAPLFRIEKRPKLRDKQGAYAVLSTEGRVLKRGHDLRAVLKVFEKKRMTVVD